MSQPSSFHGFLVIDKPAGLTSRDVVNRALGWFPRRTRLGHAGTLDPLATGVLPLAIGVATRLIEYVQRWDKSYDAGIIIGGTSDTDDAEGAITQVEVRQVPDRRAVEQTLNGFLGEIEQVPPAYSAAHVTGRRAYDLARQGEEVDLAPRRVRIEHIDIVAFDYPRLDLRVRCGKGTYIRSLARDLGQRLDCGGYIERLRRTQVGKFDLSQAMALDVDVATARSALQPLGIAVADLPRLVLSAADVQRVRQGQALDAQNLGLSGGEVAMFQEDGRLAGVGAIDPARSELRPAKMLTY